MGGLGKTTLASTVFNHQKVIAHFKLHAWITVSQYYTQKELLRDLLKMLYKEKGKVPPQDISEMPHHSLFQNLKSYLRPKRYVIVFDDVWDVAFWDEIMSALYDNRNGSRVIITTRMMDVVISLPRYTSVKVHELKPLTLKKSMELFCKKAFAFQDNGRCPEDLRDISAQFVRKCQGLPLAIVAIGGLLSRKEMTSFKWEEIFHNLRSDMMKNHHLVSITKILGFSYDDLPYYLKSCLLYFGIYPGEYEVRSKRLILQWIAEGFIKDEEGKTSEGVARQYLSELIARSLVQVSSFTIDGTPRSCHVHNLLYDLILIKSKDSCFSQHNGRKNRLMSSEIIRRLSISDIYYGLMESAESPHTRSLLVFSGKRTELTNYFVQRIPTKYKLLRVLDFEDALLSSVPGNWGILAHLKYLNLRKSWNLTSASLVTLIGKLQNLETLDVRNTLVKEMPKEIFKLTKLRHLLCNGMRLHKLNNGLVGMMSLQTLRQVQLSMDDDGLESIRELEKLEKLRNLGLTNVMEEQGTALCCSIDKMQNLEKLHIESKYEEEVIDLHAITSLPMLQKLSLYGKLKKFPEWVSQLQNLVKLSLKYSKLTDDPLESLQQLPYLLFLNMNIDAYVGETLHFQERGFQRLKELYLKYLFHLNSIIIDEKALQSLEKLECWAIPQLETVPSGIQHLRKLEILDIGYMSTEFNGCIDSDGGRRIIQHVPLVRITSEVEGEIKTRSIHLNIQISKRWKFGVLPVTLES